ncbi:MAG: transposase [Thermodesulfovibrionia bacterium]
MARPLRIEYEDAVYHVTARGNDRKKVYFCKTDYPKFLEYIAKAKKKYGILLHCYVLMSNHYHLIIETPDANLSKALHHINGSYTSYINNKRKRSGHLFQGRYKAIVVSKDSYLSELSRYIHLNPVRAGIVQSPEEYPYSSYKAYISKEKDNLLNQELVLGLLCGNEMQAKRKYRKFVDSAIGAEPDSPFENVYGGIILGANKFIKDTLSRIKEEYLQREEISNRKLLQSRHDVEEVIEAVARYFKAGREYLINNRNRRCRKIAIYLLKKHTGVTNREIGEIFGGLSYSAVSRGNERFQTQLQKDRKLKKEIKKIESKM